MRTSYFGKSKNHPKAVAICSKPPDWWTGKSYPKLGPTWSIFSEYKYKGGTEAQYTKRFNEEVLAKLNAKEVLQALEEDAVLLCHEKPDEFCHRHLVARWLEQELGVIITEI